jgi:hypothetical protein
MCIFLSFQLIFSWIVLSCRSVPDDCVGHWQAPQLQEGIQELPQGQKGRLPLPHLNNSTTIKARLNNYVTQHLVNLLLGRNL